MKKIIVVGSINIDLVITAPYIPKAGETLIGSNFFTAHGGKGANQAVAAARLGGNVIMCGCVGNDVFGKAAIASLKEDGIDVSNIKIMDGVSTGTAVIVVENEDNRIILDEGANAYLTRDDVDKVIRNANEGDIYLTQLENPIDVIGYGLKKAREKGLITILNPAPARVEIAPYFKYCTILIPNELEAESLGGKERLLDTVDTLLITLGDQGFAMLQKDKCKAYSCMKVKAIDTTAAGDTMCGGTAAKLSQGVSLEESALFGSVAASIACTRKGAQPSIPYKDEIENKMAEALKNILHN